LPERPRGDMPDVGYEAGQIRSAGEPWRSLGEGFSVLEDVARIGFKIAGQEKEKLEQQELLAAQAVSERAQAQLAIAISERADPLIREGKYQEAKGLLAEGGEMDSLIETAMGDFGQFSSEIQQKVRKDLLATGTAMFPRIVSQALQQNRQIVLDGYSNRLAMLNAEVSAGGGFIEALSEHQGYLDSVTEALGLGAEAREEYAAKAFTLLSKAHVDSIIGASEETGRIKGLTAARKLLSDAAGTVPEQVAKDYKPEAQIRLNNAIERIDESLRVRSRAAEANYDKEARKLNALIRKEAKNLASGDEKAAGRAAGYRSELSALVNKYPEAETYLSDADANMQDAQADLSASQLVGSAIDGSLTGTSIILPTSRAGAKVNESLATIISDPNIDDSGKAVLVNNVFSSMNGPVDSGKMFYGNLTTAATRDNGYAEMLSNTLASLEQQNPTAWANFIKTKEGRQAFNFSQIYQLNIAGGASQDQARQAAIEAIKRPYNNDVIEERRKYLEGNGEKLFAATVNDTIDNAIDAAYQNTGFSGFFGKDFMDGVAKNKPGYRAVRDRIISRAKDAYASVTSSDDPEADMKRAVQIAAADVRNEYSYIGGEFRRSTPFTFAGSRMTQKAMTDDIASKLKAGTWVEGASDEGIKELLEGVGEWFGNESTGWILYERRNNGLVPVLDEKRNPFIYKPAVVSRPKFVKGTQGRGGGVYIIGE